MRAFGYSLFVIVLDLLVIAVIYLKAEQRSAASEDTGTQGEKQVLLMDPETGIAIDPKTRLLMGEGFDIVKAECVECHPTHIIRSFNADRAGWTDTLRWMQRDKGLKRFEPDVEERLLTYLTTYYGK